MFGLLGFTTSFCSRGQNDKVHIFERHRSRQNSVAEHQRAGETVAILELNLDWANVRDNMRFAVGRNDLSLLNRWKLKLQGNVFWNT